MKTDKEIKFISYSGEFPNLCSGDLKIEVGGKLYKLCYILSSGGSVSFDPGWMEHITSGPWIIHEDELPEELKAYADDIERLVNENIPYGCCGGCV